MKWFQAIFLENLGTKIMALVLALLLWIYLYRESTASDKFQAAIQPKYDQALDLYSVTLLGPSGQPLDGKIDFELTGPKGEVLAIKKGSIRCEPRFDRASFSSEEGAFQYDPKPDDLNLSPNLRRITFSPAQVTVKYVRYRTVKVPVVLPPEPYEGKPKQGFVAAPPEIEKPPGPDHLVAVRFPANRVLEKIRLKAISVKERVDSFRTSAVPDVGDFPVEIRGEIVVQVRIAPEAIPETLEVDVYAAGKPEVLRKWALKKNRINVRVTGPLAEIQRIRGEKERNNLGSLFYAVAVVESPPAPVTEIYCNVRDPKLRERILVEILPGQPLDLEEVK